MTTQRKKKRKRMTRKRRSTMGRFHSQSWSHGVAGAWSVTPAFVSSHGEIAMRRKTKRTRMKRRRMRKENTTCTGRTVTQMVRFTKMKTQMKTRMSPQ